MKRKARRQGPNVVNDDECAPARRVEVGNKTFFAENTEDEVVIRLVVLRRIFARTVGPRKACDGRGDRRLVGIKSRPQEPQNVFVLINASPGSVSGHEQRWRKNHLIVRRRSSGG